MAGTIDPTLIIRSVQCCSGNGGCDDCLYKSIWQNSGIGNCTSYMASDVLKLLEKLKPKTGHWVEHEDYNLDTYYDCSVCGESWTTIEGTPWQNGMNYCPHCGAKMDT